jgi:enterochelin esterase-like enzyme
MLTARVNRVFPNSLRSSFPSGLRAHRLLLGLGLAAFAGFLSIGAVGVERYGLNYWVYRGFAPPKDASYVTQTGTVQHITVRSTALGGRRQQVVVYLPPGYATSTSRYPVLYLLHGFPGKPMAFLDTVQMGVVEDQLVALHKAKPVILVMPFGSTGQFTDEEWANGVSPGNGWATFVWRDVVHAVDKRYRTVARASARGIGGLSEGGYGAINIALHHPREFGLVESWSGYELPDKIRSIFGAKLGLLSRNDPMTMLPHVAAELRRLGRYFWIYSGRSDKLRLQNRVFARELSRSHVAHRYFETAGGHTWALWRKEATNAYLVAAHHLRG